MTHCTLYDEMLISSARGELLGRREEELRTHIESCASCKRKLSRQEALSSELSIFAANCMDSPPASLEAALRAQFREACTNRNRTNRKWAARMWIGAAVTTVMAAVLIDPHVESARGMQHQAASKIGPSGLQPRSSVSATAVRSATPSDGFIPIPDAEPLRPGEQIDIYRVDMPRLTLTQFGMALDAGPEPAVRAELAVGEDGIARAIRFVP